MQNTQKQPTTRPAQPYVDCALCAEPKPIYRRMYLTDVNGNTIDYTRICRDCWNEIRTTVEDTTELVDKSTEA